MKLLLDMQTFLWLVAKWTAAYQIPVLPIDLPHARNVTALPHHHSDPSDRLMIFQTEIEAMTLVSADRRFTSYSIPLLW